MTSRKPYIRFVTVTALAHTMAYLVAGGLAYQLITKEFWEGPNPVLSGYLRTPGNAELWSFAMTWQIPGQLLRGLLIGLVLLPLHASLKEWAPMRTFLFFSSSLFVFTHLSAAAPSPANIEGLVYMRPEYVQLGFFRMQPEMILYSIIAGLIFCKFAYKRKKTTKA